MNEEIRYKLLLIDDEENLLTMLKAIMQRAGYEVIGALSGEEGIKAAKQEKPDLILCDMMMPPPNGIEVRKTLSSDPETMDIPFIYLTAMADQQNTIEGLSLGADDYITKPFIREELLARVKAVLRRNEIGIETGKKEGQKEIQKIKQELIANVSHELRTPLSKIMFTLNMALDNRFKDCDEQEKLMRQAISNAQHLQSLIEDIITLTNIDQEKMNTFRQEVDLEFDFHAVIKDIEEKYKDKNLHISVVIDPEAKIHAPRAEFRHAIQHILDNACKYNIENGRVDIHLASNGEGGCILTVQDEGPGIPDEYHEKVFDRYFQLSHGDTREYLGMGVGLPISRALMRSLGGEVKINPSALHTVIELSLPPAEADWKK